MCWQPCSKHNQLHAYASFRIRRRKICRVATHLGVVLSTFLVLGLAPDLDSPNTLLPPFRSTTSCLQLPDACSEFPLRQRICNWSERSLNDQSCWRSMGVCKCQVSRAMLGTGWKVEAPYKYAWPIRAESRRGSRRCSWWEAQAHPDCTMSKGK